MKAEIEKNVAQARVDLIESAGGVFEVEANGKLVFSKKQVGRFPEDEEVLSGLTGSGLASPGA